jgi:hypothetical protein
LNAIDDVRTLLGPADPAANPEIGPPVVTTADLIARADREPRPISVAFEDLPMPGRITRRKVLVAAGLAVGVAGSTAVPLLAALRDRAPDVSLPAGRVVAPLVFQLREDPPTAREQLRALARQIGDAPHDGRTGRYAYHHTRDWGMTVQTADGHDMSYVQEHWTWIAADGTGRIRTVQLEPEFPDAASERYWRKMLRDWKPDPSQTTSSPTEDIQGPSGRRAAPADRTALAEALHLQTGGADTAKAVFDLSTLYILSRTMRATLLELLAEARGFVWRGNVTDRAGRTGVAVSNDDAGHDVRSVLVFDSRTGELLAFEFVQAKASKVTTYGLLLETNWTEQPG